MMFCCPFFFIYFIHIHIHIYKPICDNVKPSKPTTVLLPFVYMHVCVCVYVRTVSFSFLCFISYFVIHGYFFICFFFSRIIRRIELKISYFFFIVFPLNNEWEKNAEWWVIGSQNLSWWIRHILNGIWNCAKFFDVHISNVHIGKLANQRSRGNALSIFFFNSLKQFDWDLAAQCTIRWIKKNDNRLWN